MNRGREWRNAINPIEKKSASSSDKSSTSSSPSSYSYDSDHSDAISSFSLIESRSLLQEYSEEEAASSTPSSSSFLCNVMSNSIIYSIQNHDYQNTKLILSLYNNDIDYDLSHTNWVSE